MTESLEELEFIGTDFTWQPIVTGNVQIDYLYGFQCAYRYSAWLVRALAETSRHKTMKDNIQFRQSINSHTPEGQGFQDAIMGKPNKYNLNIVVGARSAKQNGADKMGVDHAISFYGFRNCQKDITKGIGRFGRMQISRAYRSLQK